MLKITKRTATLNDFFKLKSLPPCKDWRNSVGKALNFNMMYGASAMSFSGMLESRGFTNKMAEDMIKLLDLEPRVAELQKTNKRLTTRKKAVYYACAEYMREAFFKSYPGLEERIRRERTFAFDHAYIRDWHGTVRHLPELAYMDIDRSTFAIRGADKEFDSATFSHLMNQAVNTSVQTGECIPVFETWIELCKHLKAWNMKTRIFNSTHDSFDSYVYKPEFDLYLSMIDYFGSRHRPPCQGIYMRFDTEVANMRTYEERSKTFYKNGKEVKATKSIEQALKEWSEKQGKEFILEEDIYKDFY